MEDTTFPPHIVFLAAKVGGVPWSYRETDTEIIIVLTTGHKFKFDRVYDNGIQLDTPTPPASVPQTVGRGDIQSPSPMSETRVSDTPKFSKKGGRSK